ncbi:DNA topoisomerase 3 [Flavonifractor plautii]|uniref:DNA topoisomerase 3 n=1 Tax=Flavonifractor plautii TaxID=292800 RepID=A0A174LQS6_FLAPL|nr:DNA topoisomerase 3 [Flavonifractor plautii]
MAKTLVLAEKPSVARELARVLGCKQSGEGYLEGEKYIVTWALGHLVELAPPEDYDKAWAKWDMLTLPMLPERMKTVVIPQSGRGSSGPSRPSFAGGTWASWSSPPTRAGRGSWWPGGFWRRPGGRGRPGGCGSPPRPTRPSGRASPTCGPRRSTTTCSAPPAPAARPTGWWASMLPGP